MSGSQINPLLIQQLLEQENANIAESPTMRSLPGKYVKAIYKNKKLLSPIIEENHHMLTCKSCGRKGKYDVGLVVLNIDKKEKSDQLRDNIQLTGYFRCKHCNDAGNWELPTGLLMQAMTGALPLGEDMQSRATVGENRLFDGSWHRYSTDAEEHLLGLLRENPQDSFVWNRLGNLYHKGNRPELAASVLEHSLRIDPRQVESHFTLGDLLAQINDLNNAGYHLRQMLVFAESYKKMQAKAFREMLANGLWLLFKLYEHTNGEVPFLPTLDEIEATGRNKAMPKIEEMEIEISPDDVESFFPIAEMYMGVRAKEIPLRERTLKMPSTSNQSSKPRKKKQRKKKKRR